MMGKGTIVRDARRLSGYALEDLRRRVVNAVSSGTSQSEVARLFDVSRATVNRWMQAYRSSGEESFHPRKRGRREGEQFSLSAQQQEQITHCVTNTYPDMVELPYLLWCRQAVGDLILRLFDIQLSLTSVSTYLRRWGFTIPQPLPRAQARSSAAVRVWRSTEYPSITKAAQSDSAVIYWMTWMSLHYRAVGDDGRRKLREKSPTEDDDLYGVNVLFAISNRGSLFFAAHTGECDAEKVIKFLDRLSQQAERSIHVIVDAVEISHRTVLHTWLDTNQERVTAYFPFSAT